MVALEIMQHINIKQSSSSQHLFSFACNKRKSYSQWKQRLSYLRLLMIHQFR